MNPRLPRGSSRQEGKSSNPSTAAVQAASIAAAAAPPRRQRCRRRLALLPSAGQLHIQSHAAVFPVLFLLACCFSLTSSSSTVLRGRARPEEAAASTWRGGALWGTGGTRAAEGAWSGGGLGRGEAHWAMQEEEKEEEGEEEPSWVSGQERTWRNDRRTYDDDNDKEVVGAFTSPLFATKRMVSSPLAYVNTSTRLVHL